MSCLKACTRKTLTKTIHLRFAALVLALPASFGQNPSLPIGLRAEISAVSLMREVAERGEFNALSAYSSRNVREFLMLNFK